MWHRPEPGSALSTRTMPSTVTSSPARQLPTRSPVSSTSMVRGTLLSSDSSISCTSRCSESPFLYMLMS